jgi:hypothetical protein
MSDRLTELQRQRALAQEQLAWLGREIARESGQTLPAALSPERGPVATPRSAPAVRVAADAEAAARAAEEILARYQQPGPTLEKNVKRGCYIYFFVALAALGLFAVGAYFLYVNYRR